MSIVVCPFRPLTFDSDHFDQEVEDSLRRSLPIITTPHAKSHLAHKAGENEAFTAVHELDTFQSLMVDIHRNSNGGSSTPAIKITAMPGKHVPPGALGTLNDLVKAVSRPYAESWRNTNNLGATNKWMDARIRLSAFFGV
jgi:hypothetical protein